MFDQRALEAEWQEAREAWYEHRFLDMLGDRIYERTYDCKHPEARRKKDGTRDKRYACKPCDTEMWEAQEKCQDISYRYSDLWNFFERIGCPVNAKQDNGAAVPTKQ